MSDMSDQKKSGANIRLVILLAILGVVAVGFYYDRFIMPQKSLDATAKLQELMDSEEANTSGIKPDQVHAKLGFQPDETLTDSENNFYVETYKFRRLLPFVAGESLNVIYSGVDENKSMVKYQNKPYDPAEMDDPSGGWYLPPKDVRKEVFIGGFGGGGGNAKNEQVDDDDDKEGDEGKVEEGDENKAGEGEESKAGEGDAGKGEGAGTEEGSGESTEEGGSEKGGGESTEEGGSEEGGGGR